MEDAIRRYSAFARLCCIIAGWALLLMAFAATIEMLSRKFLNVSFQGLDEIGGYMMAGVSAVGFAYALVTRSHMRVTLLFPYVPFWVHSILNVLAMVTLAAMAMFCAYRGYYEVAESVSTLKRSNTPLQAPLWIPQLIWFFGMVVFAVGTLLTAAHALQLAFSNTPLLNRLYGPQTLEEEISTEVSQAEQRERITKAAQS